MVKRSVVVFNLLNSPNLETVYSKCSWSRFLSVLCNCWCYLLTYYYKRCLTYDFDRSVKADTHFQWYLYYEQRATRSSIVKTFLSVIIKNINFGFSLVFIISFKKKTKHSSGKSIIIYFHFDLNSTKIMTHYAFQSSCLKKCIWLR